MPKTPRKESYRVTFIRPVGMSVTEVKNSLLEPFIRKSIDAKVELIRGSAELVEQERPAEQPKSFWQRIFG